MRLAVETGAGVFVYSRYGHGDSETLAAPRKITYMHEEGERVLPDLLRQAGIEHPILLGQSDGASIAIIYAGRFPDAVGALILEAPHVFVEPVAIESIAQAKVAYETTDLRQRLGRYHAHVETMFRGWNDIWLDPAFRPWNIESSLDAIRCPVLVIHGEDDEYGTLVQVAAIRARVPSVEVAIWPQCRHAPHRDQPDLTIRRIAEFLAKLGYVSLDTNFLIDS